MKTFIIIISALVLVSFSGFGQNSESKTIPEFLKFYFEDPEYIYGNVKEMHCNTFDAVEQNGKIVNQGLIITNFMNHMSVSYYFSPKCQIVQLTAKNLMGNWICIPNDHNNKLLSINWLNENQIKFKWEYAYSGNGEVECKVTDVLSDEPVGLTSYIMDNNGFITKQINFNTKNNSKGNTIIYERDEDGTITNKKVEAPDGKLQEHFDKWEYKNGKKYKIHRTVLEGKKVDKYGPTHTYEFDEKGNWIKRTSVNPDNNNIRVTERKFVFF